MADKNEFRFAMRSVCRLRVGWGLIQPVERMLPEDEQLVSELAESFGWRDEWLQDEELCQKQTEMHAMMTSFARTQSETLFELMKQNPSITFVPVALLVAQQTEEAGEKPGNGNDTVSLSGCVSEGMAEALGLDIDNEALKKKHEVTSENEDKNKRRSPGRMKVKHRVRRKRKRR